MAKTGEGPCATGEGRPEPVPTARDGEAGLSLPRVSLPQLS